MALYVVQFVKTWKIYYAGDIAGFELDLGKELEAKGIAVPYHKEKAVEATVVAKAPADRALRSPKGKVK